MEENRWAQFVALDGATKVRTAKALFGYDESAGNVEEYICSIHGHEPTDQEVEEWGELDEFGSILSFFRKKLIRIGVKHDVSVPTVRAERKEEAPPSPVPMARMGRQVSLVHLQNHLGTASGGAVDEIADEISDLDAKKQLELLREENLRLQNLLTMSETAIYGGSSVTGQLTPSDIETLRAIFDSMDTNNNGCVFAEDFVMLHRRLGEEITDDEVNTFMTELDPHHTGEVSFNKFLFWWHAGHEKGKKSERYRERFKLISTSLVGDFDHSKVIVKPVGQKGSPEFRITVNYELPNGRLKQISPWHDIPLVHVGRGLEAKIFNFVCEIPKWTRAKFEIATGEPLNPIKQDVKNGKLRFYQHGDMMFNYGAFPQTYEDPNHVPEDTGCPGDNDPIDAIELGTRQLRTGSITPVKVLGVLALLDSGETDWKLLCVNIGDPLAHLMHDIHDVDRQLPGAIRAIREFLRVYKVCTGQAENRYALRGEAMNQEYAIRVIEECHQQWEQLRAQEIQTV